MQNAISPLSVEALIIEEPFLIAVMVPFCEFTPTLDSLVLEYVIVFE